jgi:hypothetical protein
MLELLLYVALLGFVLWLIERYVPMVEPLRVLFRVIVVIVVIVLVLQFLGLSLAGLGLGLHHAAPCAVR